MIVRQFIEWSQKASARARAEGVGALARAYLYSDLADNERHAAELALFAALDDPSPLVRRSMAESFASAVDAPPAIICALANDQSEIASIVLGRSPLLTDAQLIDCAAVGDAGAQAAIALRAELSPVVASALAEIASREALIALAVNDGANLPDFAMRRMIERFGQDGELREALLARAWLPGAIRADLAAATARQLADLAVDRNWMSRARSERVAQESRENAAMIIAAGCAAYSGETAALAAYLRVSGQLTPGLALRSLLCGQTGLFEATLTELTGIGPRRVAGLVKDPASNAFAAIYVKAGLPTPLLPAFCAALAALARFSAPEEEGQDCMMRLPIIEAALQVCLQANEGQFDRLIALLRRFEADALRQQGRRGVAAMQSADVQKPSAVEARELAPSIASQTGDEAALAESTAPLVQPFTLSAADETEIVIDLTALEKELMAA